MGQKRVELLQCEEPIASAQLLDMQNNANQHVNNVIQDLLGEGVLTADVVPMATGIGVSISNFECYSQAGHGKQLSSIDVDLAAHLPSSGYRWVSIFATPGWELGDHRANYYSVNEHHNRTEKVTFSVVNGSATTLPTNPGGGAVRVRSVRLHSTTTTLIQGMIKSASIFSDSIESASNKLSKSGGNLEGGITFNGRPLGQFNKGKFTFETDPTLINTTPINPDFHGHHILTSGWIDSGIKNENLIVQIAMSVGFYQFDDSVVTCRVSPVTFRMHTDLGSMGQTHTETINIIYEEDENGQLTGKFVVSCIGASHFVNRFAGNTVYWTAMAPQPVSGGVGV